MLTVPELNFGSIDAVNYKHRKDREFLAKIFFRDSYLEDILQPKKYFLIGEKGTGKTAYAVLLNNTDHHKTRSSVFNVTATDYQSFLRLKKNDHLSISSYKDIWKVILLLLAAKHIVEKEPGNVLSFMKFSALNRAIDSYYDNAFDPEVINALKFVEHADATAELVSQFAKFSVSRGGGKGTSSQKFQINLLALVKMFMEGISEVKLERDHIVFIDGIDIRPSDIEFREYIECIKGLSQACWELNTEHFANIRDSKGRIKIVLLLRPDIFAKLDFQNANARVQDNGVVLDWRTTYSDYRNSRIFQMVDGIVGKQQYTMCDLGEAWDYYFPYDLPNLFTAESVDNPFIGFLRYSQYRPRDVIYYLLIMQNYVREQQ